MRIYQAGFGTSVAYSSFKDVAFTDQSFFIGTTSVAINRASAALTLNGVNISGTAASETFATVTGRGASTTTQISVGTTSSGSMYTGIKSGAGYSDTVSGATFKSITDHPTGGSFAFAAYYNGAPGTGTNSFYVAASGGAYFAQGVGIGVSSPLQALHINGNIILDGTTNGYTQSASRAIGYGSNNGAVLVDGFSGMEIQSVNAPAPNGGNYSQNLRFWTHHYGTGTGSTPRMILQYNGYVGIGTTAPAALLQIGTGTPTASADGIQFGNDTSARLYRSSSGVVSASNSFAALGGFVYASNYLQTGGNLIYPASFSATQRLEIGNAAQNAWITGISIAPGGNVVVAGTLTESSSIRYKENIETIFAPILPKLNQIRPVTYNKKDNPKHIEYGIIAEELNELFPEFVNKNEKGEVESVNYSRLTVILIKAVKELQEEVEKLKNK
jgi:hypothetical protein